MFKILSKKKIILSAFFLITLCNPKLHSKNKPNKILVASLMIKDESHCIQETLQPLADGGITEFFIFDTGSTDGTQDIVKKFFKDNNVHGILIEEPFIDFSTSRNRALELTEELFPDSPFILMLDANWYVRHVPEMIDFCLEHQDDPMPSYFMEVKNYTPYGINRYRSSRIFRRDAHVRYHGVVHEYIDNEKIFPEACLPKPIIIDQIPGEIGDAKTIARLGQDCKNLLNALEKNPNDARSAFYLAQSFACRHDIKNAYTYYKLRTQIPGYDEETYIAWYRLASMTLILMDQDQKYSWQEAQDYYLKAYSLRPWRAEPIVRIAQYYLAQKNYPLAYLFGLRACELPIPVREREAMDHNAYSFERYKIVQISAKAMGYDQLSEWAKNQIQETK